MIQLDFKGECKGVRLVQRGKTDKQVCIQIITEDDGNWSVDGGAFSSYWFDDLQTQLNAAKAYMDANCTKGQWGYEFK